MKETAIQQLTITSPVFEDKGHIPIRYSCMGKNINPPIAVHNLPEGTRSLALVIEDPDAAKGTFDHWVTWNISPDGNIEEGSSPGTEGRNGSGGTGYTGPCPPSGTGVHHYRFLLYALDKKLDLEVGANKSQLKTAMKGHVLGKGELTGLMENHSYAVE